MEPRQPATNPLKTKMAMTIMAEDRDSPVDIAPRFKYAIFSQPRTGSTALAKFLAAREFGDPAEFINMHYIQAYCRIRGITKVGINDYLDHLFRRRSSPNGIFGIKIHVNQFTAIARQGKRDTGVVARDIMGRFDKIVVMKRRNKLRQTSSYYWAIETDTWNPAQDRGGGEDVAFDVSKFAALLATVIAWDFQMDELVEDLGASAMTLDYEDLADDTAASLRRVVDFLDMDAGEGALDLPDERQVMRSSGKRDLEARFLEAIGVASE